MNLIYLLVWLSASFSGFVFANENQTMTTKLAAGLNKAALDSKAGAILTVQGCNIDYNASTGFANRKSKEPMPLNERLRVASIGKLYTASVIYHLVDSGLIDLEQPLNHYLQSSEIDGIPNTHATLKQLLNHTSGIPDYYDFRSYLFWDWKQPLNWERIKPVAQRRKAEFQPGDQYSYSNTGYHLLALVAEKVTKLSFKELISAYIIDPLELTQTQYNTQHPGGTIHGYGTILRPWADTWALAENTGPDSGITVTSIELSRFLASTFLADGEHVGVGLRMTENPVQTESANQYAGKGAETLRAKDGLELHGHTGDTFGYLSFAYAIPEYDATLVGHINAAKPEILFSLLAETVAVIRLACAE